MSLTGFDKFWALIGGRKFIAFVSVMGFATIDRLILQKMSENGAFDMVIAATAIYSGTNIIQKIFEYRNGKSTSDSTKTNPTG